MGRALNEPALPNWMGSLHPNASLYEKPLDLRAAQREHAQFRAELEKYGCKVMTVREILAHNCDEDVVARVKLEDLAFSCLTYKLVGSAEDLSNNELYLLSDKYKRECIEKMDVLQLVEVVLTLPTLELQKADKDTELRAINYSFSPLVNLVFNRDQQITTAKGVVMARPRSEIRSRELQVMRFCFDKLRVPVIGEVQWPGSLEGGDFFPAGKDLCFIGIGLRSNMDACRYLMEKDLLGTNRVAVVKDYFDQDQQRMHLDTVFNILAPKLVLCLETIMGESSPRRRLVDEYIRGVDGIYRLGRHDVEFEAFLKSENYTIIPVTEQMQFQYGCNGLNLGRNTLITADKMTAKHLARSEHFSGKIITVDFTNITNMYGSVHCCSQVISRRDPSKSETVKTFETATHLCNAAARGSLPEVLDLLDKGADPSSSDYDRRTPLHVASRDGHFDIVSALVERGAAINAIDGWSATALDEAIKSSRSDVVTYLRSQGGATATELEDTKKRESMRDGISPMVRTPSMTSLKKLNAGSRWNSCRSAVMIAPDNFYVNLFTASDNPFMREAENTFNKFAKELPDGRRGVYHLVLKQFTEFHRLLTVECGMQIYLFTHLSFEAIPDAVFCYDWFSTHNEDEQSKSTLVLYPMKAPTRRNERRDEIVSFLMGKYNRLINLSLCEDGNVKASNSFDFGKIEYRNVERDGIISSQSDGEEANACKALEHSSMVLDRMHKIAYAAVPSDRLDKEVLDIWIAEMGYELITFPISVSIHHTRALLCIGTNFAIVCSEVIDKSKRGLVLEKLATQGRKVVQITLNQALSFAAYGALEILDPDNKPVLILSTTAQSVLLEEQIADLTSTVSKVFYVDISSLEKLGGGSISGVIGGLF